MSRAQVKRELARIKRAADIDFAKQAYEAAVDRHRYRMKTLRLADDIRESKRALRNGRTEEEGLLTEKEIERAERELKADRARDTPESWRRDQATIEGFHLKRYGHLDFAKRLRAYGANAKEMWNHIVAIHSEGVREAEEQANNGTVDVARQKFLREGPVRLHPSPNRVPPEFEKAFGPQKLYYTPEFADGTMAPEIAYFYPYSEYPEFDGDTILEFYDEGG